MVMGRSAALEAAKGQKKKERKTTKKKATRTRPAVALSPGFMKVKASEIKTKAQRTEVFRKQKAEKKRLKSERQVKREKEREALGDAAPPKEVPKTQDNQREKDETVVAADDEEVLADEATDEFAAYFQASQKPKILVTTSARPRSETRQFVVDLLRVFPNSTYYERKQFDLKEIVEYASDKEFTDIIVVNENRKQPNQWLQFHLPNGPTARFKLTSVHPTTHLRERAQINLSRPEVILNNFTTRLGHRVGRMLGSLFEQTPHFQGRRVCTFHNQRDFIFFRHHRYIFDDKGARASIQELGPSFTLKLQQLHAGLMDAKHGEFEWVHKNDMDTSRRRFFL